MRDVLPVSWPCRVSRSPEGRYIVTPFEVLPCACDGPTLQAASDFARKALCEHLVRSGKREPVAVPSFEHVRPEDLRAGKVIRLKIALG